MTYADQFDGQHRSNLTLAEEQAKVDRDAARQADLERRARAGSSWAQAELRRQKARRDLKELVARVGGPSVTSQMNYRERELYSLGLL